MRKVLWSVFVLLAVASCLAGPAWAQQTVFDYDGDCRVYYKMTALTSSSAIPSTYVTHSSWGKARSTLLSVESSAVRMTLDGTAATTSVGHTLSSGDSYVIRGYHNINNARFAEATAGTLPNVILTICY